MPCYEVRRIAVALAIADLDLLAEAFRSIGMTHVERYGERVQGNSDYGAVEFYRGNLIMPRGMIQANFTNTVKRAYSQATIKKAAKRFGWKVKQRGSKMKVSRGTY